MKNSLCVFVLCRASGGLVGGPEMFGEVRSHAWWTQLPLFLLSLLSFFFPSLFSSSSQHKIHYITCTEHIFTHDM